MAIGQLNPTQLSSRLAAMSDQQLQQYAALHQDDPYVLAIAMDVKNQRDAARQNAMVPPQQAQPTVVQQLIARMAQLPPMQGGQGQQMPPQQLAQPPQPQQPAPQPQAPAPTQTAADGGLMSGIAQLPARNLQRMKEGGIAGYADRGLTESDPKQAFAMQYRDLATRVGEELGVDPGLIIAQWALETDWGRKTVGQYNLGNIKDPTGRGPKAVDRAEGSRDAYRTYETPEAFAADYVAQMKRNWPGATGAGRDPAKFAEGLRKGRLGAYASDPSYDSKLASTFSSLIPSAQAATPAAPPTPAGQIPAGGYTAPAAVPQEEGFFGRMGTQLGMSEETKRNLANLSTALGGAMGPAAVVSGLPKAPGALATTGERIYNLINPSKQMTAAEIVQAQKMADPLRTAKAVQAAQRAGAEAGATLEETQGLVDLARRTQAAERAARAAQVPTPAQAAQNASLLRQAAEANRVVGAGRAAQNIGQTAGISAGLAGLAATEEAKKAAAAQPPRPISEAERAKMAEANASPSVADAAKAVAVAEKALPPERRKGMDWEDLMMFGFALMSGQSPYALQNVGAAGMAMLKGRREREQAEREETYRAALSKQAESLAAKYGAEVDVLKTGTSKVAQAVKAADLAFDNYVKGLGVNKIAALNATPEAMNAIRLQLLREAYAQYGLDPATIPAPSSAAPSAGGFKVVGVRNP